MDTATHPRPRVRQYADPFACPACAHRLPLDVERCPDCGLLLQSLLARQLLMTLRTADNQLAQLITASHRQPSATPEPTLPEPLPTPVTPEHRGLSEVTVPRLLLGIGALCLLVAAVIFLALTWSWLGIGGRTAVLAGLTVVTGGLGVWLTGRDLRIAGESLTTVALGLLTLDVLGADSADWLGQLDVTELTMVLGCVLLAAALPLALATRLVAPQVVAAGAWSLVGAGLLVESAHASAVIAAVVLGYAVLAGVAGARRLTVLVVAAALGAASWWLGLVAYGLEEADSHLSVRGLWVEGHGVALLTAALMLLLPVWFARQHAATSRAFAAAAAAMLTATAALPAADESTTVIGVVTLLALVGWTGVTHLAPAAWKPVPLAPLALAALPVAIIATGLGAQAFSNAVLGYESAIEAAPALLLLGVAGLLAASHAVHPPIVSSIRVPVAVLSIAAIGTLALHPVPAWTIVAALTVFGVALVADAWWRSDGLVQTLAGLGVVAGGGVVAWPDDGLLAAVLGVLVVASATLHWRGAAAQRPWGGALLPVTLGGLMWVALGIADVDVSQRGVPILVVLGILAIAHARPEVEIAAATSGGVAASVAVGASVDPTVALAVHLTIAGALASASALAHSDRRELGWLGGALLAAATWVRLADIGVTAPEPYTLPTAVALLVVGLSRLQRDPGASTMQALAAGLFLATVPSFLWVLADPVSLRAVLLGAACLGLVVLGAALRWNAPLVVGSLVGTATVLVELAPYVAEVPQWLLIGLAGTVLTALGVTWERRLRDLRAAAAYVGRLR